MHTRNSHCSYCGQPFAAEQAWPRGCGACGNISYLNPLPVAVALLPVDNGVLAVRRTIPPKIGELALPGGYIDIGETWQEAAARELFEEAGITIDPAELTDFHTRSDPVGNFLLVFGVACPRRSEDLPPFEPTSEASERVVVEGPITLAFPLHTEALRLFFERSKV
ncbi:MAG TPA: NUDIX domain-containing protein [Roseiflexaceae bacterium]|nr:NUDIX domain-containing protein [Roseiflexaceae bacterium]